LWDRQHGHHFHNYQATPTGVAGDSPLRPSPFCGRMQQRRQERESAVLGQLLLGGGVSVINIVIHAVTMVVLIRTGRVELAKPPSQRAWDLIVVMIVTVTILMVAHFAEVVVWAAAYAAAGVAPVGSDRLYFAFVNYTTLGYGDIVPVADWRLIGPITALNGVLMIGWSTAVIFEVLRRAVRYAHGEHG
jgi:hypothetical protein